MVGTAFLRRARGARSAVHRGGATPGEVQVYRSGLARYLLPIGCGVAVVLLLLRAGSVPPGSTAEAAAWCLAVGVSLHVLLVRPRVTVGADTVTLTNPLREVRIPWSAVREVRTRFALTVVADDGTSPPREYVSWAAPAPGHPVAQRGRWQDGTAGGLRGRASSGDGRAAALPARGAQDRMIPASRGLHGDAGAAAFLVEAAWERWRLTHGSRGSARRPADADHVTGRWLPWTPIVAAGAGLLAVLLSVT